MKQVLFFLALTSLLTACSTTKKTSSKTDDKIYTVWINTSPMEDLVLHQEVGVLAFGDCYGVSYDKELEKAPYEGGVITEWKHFCGEITDFEDEEGYIYQAQIQKTKIDNIAGEKGEVGQWKLISILSKEKDIHYKKREEKTVWIGPKAKEDRCFHPLAGPDCRMTYLQFQEGDLNKNGSWELFTDFTPFEDYEEGYIYQVQYTKEYLSEFEARMIMDGPSFYARDIEVLSKEKF